MRVHCHFCPLGQVNTYLVCLRDSDCPALIVDPADLDNDLIKLIEDRRYTISGILVTHDHEQHVRALGKILKVYDAPIYAAKTRIAGFPATPLRENPHVEIAGFDVAVIEIPGHSPDSLVYKIGASLFTGDTIQAGRIANTGTVSARQKLISNIRRKLMALDDNTLVFPGHGAPTKLRVERMFNHDLLESEVALSENLKNR